MPCRGYCSIYGQSLSEAFCVNRTLIMVLLLLVMLLCIKSSKDLFLFPAYKHLGITEN